MSSDVTWARHFWWYFLILLRIKIEIFTSELCQCEWCVWCNSCSPNPCHRISDVLAKDNFLPYKNAGVSIAALCTCVFVILSIVKFDDCAVFMLALISFDFTKDAKSIPCQFVYRSLSTTNAKWKNSAYTYNIFYFILNKLIIFLILNFLSTVFFLILSLSSFLFSLGFCSSLYSSLSISFH